jgi:hypothetical protein
MAAVRRLITILLMVLCPVVGLAALGEGSLLGNGGARDAVLVRRGSAAPIHVAASDWPGVQRAARDLQADIERVTRVKPALAFDAPGSARTVVLAGTIGRSPLIDQLIARGKLDATDIRGRWEAFQIATVEQPLPGVDRALVIAGSRSAYRRGTGGATCRWLIAKRWHCAPGAMCGTDLRCATAASS